MGLNAVNRDASHHAKAHLNLADFFTESDQFESSLRQCDAAIELAPSLAEAHNLRGINLEELGRREEAIKAYKEAIRLDPGLADAGKNLSDLECELEVHRCLDLAHAYTESGELEKALHTCDTALALDPSLAEAHKLRGAVLEKLGQRVNSRRAYTEPVQLESGLEEAASRSLATRSVVSERTAPAPGRMSHGTWIGTVSGAVARIGTVFGAIAGVAIVLGFFLPWVRGLDVVISGYDLVSDPAGLEKLGLFEEATLFWLVPVVGIICVLLLTAVGTRPTRSRLLIVAFVRLLAGVIGVIPVFLIMYRVDQLEVSEEVAQIGAVLLALSIKSGAAEILEGARITALGFLGLYLSCLLDVALFFVWVAVSLLLALVEHSKESYHTIHRQ